MDEMLNCWKKSVSSIVAVTCFVLANPVLAEETPLRTLAMMAPVERQVTLEAMRQHVDAALATHRVEDYPWPIVAELSMVEAENEIVVDFDSRLAEYDMPDDTGVCHYAHDEIFTVLEVMDATAGGAMSFWRT
ncbi:hypothetical protein FIV34_04570 [Luteibacter pinisoli]|uniref:Uncharacterized protein n=1 Tax=Luteibacter pinisoli TaxID=2589080 RepID=A0A4Y5Z1J1_9GAMM|nr:hypothetical protein [Luteibacter pinisoli]QDE38525.1 hypothetical protein FIV34_04570 [Luteibacter pinisoli]